MEPQQLESSYVVVDGTDPRTPKQPFQCFTIGICGGSGSGMSTFADLLFTDYNARDPELANILHTHHYFINRRAYQKNKDGEYLFDLPSNLHLSGLNMDLAHLQIGGSFGVPIRDFESGEIEAHVSFKVAPVVIIEGIFLLYYKALRNQIDYMIFLDVPTEVRKQRRLKRDSWIDEEYYDQFIEPAYEKYVLAHRHKADRIFDTSKPISEREFAGLLQDIERNRMRELSICLPHAKYSELYAKM